jgi:hypothetical protein
VSRPGSENDVLRNAVRDRTREESFGDAASYGDERAQPASSARWPVAPGLAQRLRGGPIDDRERERIFKTGGSSNTWCAARCRAARSAVMLTNGMAALISRRDTSACPT